MPPKDKSKAAAGANKKPEEGAEEPLQALVLADAFETRFHPLTLEEPRCLLPLANTPLIDYTLEFLANAGAVKIYIIAGAHAKKVEEYIERSKWTSRTSPFAHCQVLRTEATHLSEAMRDILNKKLFPADFLLVYGDVISNLNIEPALKAHKERRAKSRDAAATMILREAGNTHRTKARGQSPVFIVDPEKNRCLHYEQMPNKDNKHHLTIDPQLLKDHDELEIRQDLIDPGIDICTEDWLALWEEYFDMKAPRRDFLSSVLRDYDLNGKTIHTHIIDDQYAARVRDLHAYDAISKDVVSRWAYPLCPDTNLLKDQTYSRQFGNIYMENSVFTARSSKILKRTVIGSGTNVGEGAVITDSVIGRNCSIGRNVRIKGAYIWDSVTIQEGAVVGKALLATEVVVGQKCKIEDGAVLSVRTKISDGVVVKGTSRITRTNAIVADEDDLQNVKSDHVVVGKDGIGFEYTEEGAEDDQPEIIPGLVAANTNLLYQMDHLSLSAESISTLNSEDEDDFEGEIGHHSAGSFVSNASADSEGSHHASNFDHEAAASLFDALEQAQATDNIILELTSLRMTTNAADHQVRRAVATAFCKRTSQLVNDGKSIKAAISEVFTKHSELIRRLCIADYDKSGKVDQVDFLVMIQRDLCHREKGPDLLLAVVTELYKIDRVEAEGVEQWWADVKSSDTEEMRKVREKTKSLIDFLEQESEEESDEDEDDDDDEEDDED